MAVILEISQVITESDVDKANCENNVDTDDDEDIDIELWTCRFAALI